jgi:hypothetical protein
MLFWGGKVLLEQFEEHYMVKMDARLEIDNFWEEQGGKKPEGV